MNAVVKPRTVEIMDVPPPMTPDAWGYVSKWVERGIEYAYGTITADDVRRGLFEADFQLFLAVDDGHVVACSVCELIRYPRKLCCNIMVVAGKANSMSRWGHQMYETIEQWGRSKGCTIVTGIGRRGWEKFVTREYGFTRARMIYTKELT